jgi:chaperone required for assembly of F1-ATPase
MPIPLLKAGALAAGRLERSLRKGFHEAGDKPRRFYKAVTVVEDEGGFAVRLDGRNVRSPRSSKLVAPTRELAELIAEEWASQTDVIELGVMHATRLAFTASEAIPAAREATAEQVAHYAGSDLLCYFAEDPVELRERQTTAWDPILARAENELGLVFARALGLIHKAQPQATLDRVKALALAADDFTLAGLAFGTSLFGSAILTLALQRAWLTGEEAWILSRVDEAFQESKWGIDEEADERTERLRVESVMLERWFKALA